MERPASAVSSAKYAGGQAPFRWVVETPNGSVVAGLRWLWSRHRRAGEELRRLGWGEADLGRRPKGDPKKMAIAARLRKQTTLTMGQIAERMHLGTAQSAHALLHA